MRAVFCGTELFCAAWTSLLSARIANLAALCGWGFGTMVVTLWVEESMKEVEFHLLIQTRFQNPRTPLEGLSSKGFELNGLARLPSY